VTTDIDVVIEIPRGSRNKYEYDHERHILRLDRRLFTATAYPADYGFIPDTLSEETDDMGPDAKIICVPSGDARWEHVTDIDGLPAHLTSEISHFFEVYKALEPNKHSSVRGWEGAEAAWAEIESCRARFTATPH
jgi:inorganic pyrophosphatase